MKRQCLTVLAMIHAALLVLGCTPKDPGPTGATAPAAAATGAATDKWIGRWTGPEGTWLDIAGANGNYQITVKDLDRARTFEGHAAGDHIEFRRDGMNDSIMATNGNDTGMKWLAGKSDCLTIMQGEGYCRD